LTLYYNVFCLFVFLFSKEVRERSKRLFFTRDEKKKKKKEANTRAHKHTHEQTARARDLLRFSKRGEKKEERA